ncbi:MAG: phosphoribosylanthranilate isomerase [Acidobacteriaceae bacterium]
MWIKICGITSLEDAQFAIRAGADAVGFVFASSPRRITPEAVRAITKELSSSVERIGVFVDAAAEEIIAACETAGLSGVQLHDECSVDRASDLRVRLKKFSPRLRVVQVVHYDGDLTNFADQLRALNAQPGTHDDLRAILVDTRLSGKLGGTGIPFDWRAAQDSFLQQAAHLRLIAAGGLRPENVRLAIQTLRPWGVDVSSGVEIVPGRKDHQRVTEFIRAARAAAMEFAESAQR